MATEISKKLKELRVKKGKNVFTLQKVCNDLSRILGKRIPVSTYSTWELGKSEPSLDILVALAGYYNVSIDTILGVESDGSEQVQQLPADIRRLIRVMRSLTPRLQREMREIVETVLEKRGEFPSRLAATPDDIIKVCDEALDLTHELKRKNQGDGAAAVQRIQANMMQNMALALELKGCFKEAINLKEKMLAGFRDHDDTQSRLAIIKDIGCLHFRMGQFSSAIQYFSDALELARSVSDAVSEVACLKNIGWVYDDMGDLKEALKYKLRAYKKSSAGEDIHSHLENMYCLIIAYRKLNQYDRCLEFCQKALEIIDEHEIDESYRMKIYLQFGNLYLEIGFASKAVSYFKEILQFYAGGGQCIETAICNHNIGTARILLSQYTEAIDNLMESLQTSRAIQDREGEINSLIELGRAYMYLGNTDKAIELHREALLLSSDTRYEFLKKEAQEAIAWDFYVSKSTGAALKHCQKIEQDEKKGKHYRMLWRVYYLKGNILRDQHKYQQAKQYYLKSIQMMEQIAKSIVDEDMRNHFMNHKERKDLFQDYAELIKETNQSAITVHGGVT